MSYQLGTEASDPIAFYGATPVTRPTNAAQAAVTDSSGGTAAPTTGVAAAAFKETILIPIGAMTLVANTVAWKVAIPYAFTISSVLFRADVPITTGAKAATLTTGIAATPCTGGVIAVAGAYATGATQAGDAVTALNVGAAGDTINIVASSVTAFSEGTGHVEVTIINNDRANAAATMIAQANALRAALVSLNLIKGS
jgi:hypothetical protein